MRGARLVGKPIHNLSMCVCACFVLYTHTHILIFDGDGFFFFENNIHILSDVCVCGGALGNGDHHHIYKYNADKNKDEKN